MLTLPSKNLEPSSKNFLYLRGVPGSGKITVARILKEKLGWHLFWFHDLKNAVQEIVENRNIPRLMDEIAQPIIRYLCTQGKNIIYVRPSPDRITIERVQGTIVPFDYHFHLVTLTAPIPILLERILMRNDHYRIHTREQLENYLNERSSEPFENDLLIDTATLNPTQVAEDIMTKINVRSDRTTR